MEPKVFTPSTRLTRPFVHGKRIDISEFQGEEALNTFIQEHCVKQGKPLVLTKLNSLPGWNKDLFDLEHTLQIFGEKGIEIQAQGNSLDKITVSMTAYVDMLRSQEKPTSSSGNYTTSPQFESTPNSSTGSNLSPLTPSSKSPSNDVSVDNRPNMKVESVTLPLIDETRDLVNAHHNEEHHLEPSIGKQEKYSTLTATSNNSAGQRDIYTGISERVAIDESNKVDQFSATSPTPKKRKYQSRSSAIYNSDMYKVDNSDTEDDEPEVLPNEMYYAKDIDTPDEYKECLQNILPPDLLPLGRGDLIRTLPSSLQAVNLMCYLGGNHTGTALHRDISGAIGHNIMTFAEDGAYAQWLVIEKPETSKLRELCQEDLGNGATKDDQQPNVKKSYFLECERAWVSPRQLASRGVVTHVILQKPGDLVIIPSLCYHQVTNVGISFKMAWNRITADSLLEGMKIQLPLYNIISRPELYRCKATVLFALKDILSNIPSPSTLSSVNQQQTFLEQCRTLLHLFAREVILPEVIEPIAVENISNNGIVQDNPLGDDEIGFDVMCDFCLSDVFHRYYHCANCEMDICLQCYSTGRSCTHIDELCMHEPSSSVLTSNESQQNDMNEYVMLYDEIVYQLNRTYGPLSIVPEFTTFQHRGDCYSLATTCRRIEQYRKNNKYLSNKLHCSHCERIFDLWDAHWDIKTIFQRRPCYKSLSYSLNSTVFVCISCTRKCFACSPKISRSRLDTEVVYFRDMSKKLELWGGFVDKGLFQSAYWPDYKVNLNTDDTVTLAELEERPWTYPEDFKQLAATELIKKITPEGWRCWAKNKRIGKDNILMADLVQQLTQLWTNSYEKALGTQATLSANTTYIYKTTPQKSTTANNSNEYDTYVTLTNLSFELPQTVLLRPIVETRGRPRKYPRTDKGASGPNPIPHTGGSKGE